MPCYTPIQAWRGKCLPSGKRAVVFNRKESVDSLVDSEIRLPCGHCIGCYLERSRQWAMRCVAEASLYKRNCFITLTYDGPHLPLDGGLVLRDWQLFMKKLRKYAKACRIRFFMAGEYGSLNRRPHFHACLFNWDFADKVLWSVKKGVRLYRSEKLERIWSKGFCSVGDVTFESAAYVARYCLKGVDGNREIVDKELVFKRDGVVVPREFVTMSRRPGIGNKWFDKFRDDLYPSDYHVVRGRKVKPARYYDVLMEKVDPKVMLDVKARRNGRAFLLRDDNDLFRLAVKEACKRDQVKLLNRSLEEVL